MMRGTRIWPARPLQFFHPQVLLFAVYEALVVYEALERIDERADRVHSSGLVRCGRFPVSAAAWCI